MTNALIQSAVAGGIAMVLGTGITFYLPGTDQKVDNIWFSLLTALASFVVMAALWWMFVARTDPVSIWRGAIVGGLGTIVIIYASFYLVFVKEYMRYHITGVTISGGPPMNPLWALFGTLATTLLTVLVIGWLTVPSGALVGTLLSWFFRTKSSS